MTYGIDTDFLVAAEVVDHPFHVQANVLLRELVRDGHDFGLAPQTLAEFVHIVTDSKRMPKPLSVSEAIERCEHWWKAVEVRKVFPSNQVVVDFFGWLKKHGLGRKRLLDTMLAATFQS